METLKKLRAWMIGPRSDFSLFVILVVLANLVSANAYLRLDLTSGKVYSLSGASERLIRTIEEPLSIKVFFTGNLPAPYNSVDRYLRDLLAEYDGVGNRRFSYEFFDMEKEENKEIARSYGINSVQIQEIRNDEVGLKNAFMGLAIVYGDGIESLNNLSSAEGLEYRLTTTIGKMISRVDTLSGLADKVTMTLYASSALKELDVRISGFNELEQRAYEAFGRVNAENYGKLEYRSVDPMSASEVDALVRKYGLQKISWSDRNGAAEAGAGVLGIVLEHQDSFRVVPFQIAGGGGVFFIVGLTDLEERLNDSLRSLMSNSLSVAYVTGHGEKDLSDEQQGAARFSALASDLYEFQELNLAEEEIPADVTTVVLNGPREKFREAELYKLDQFLLRGGNLLVFADPYNEIVPQGANGFPGQPVYLPLSTGVEEMLGRYGVELPKNYVLDSHSYVARQQGMGEIPLYYAPLVGRDGLNQNHPVSRNLANVIFLNAGEVRVSLPDGEDGLKATPLVSSSDESWVMTGQIRLDPFSIRKPPVEEMSSHHLAVLLEGEFDSAFDSAPASGEAEGEAENGTLQGEGSSAELTAETHLARSVRPGKLLVIGSSAVTTSAVLDPEGRQPVAMFVRNALDYMSGNEELNAMRTKGLDMNTLVETPPAVRSAAKGMNMYGLPLLIALAGLLAWRYRIRRKEKIRLRYAQPERERVGGKSV